MYLYPLNTYPWNTLAVNAGLIEALSAIAQGVGGADSALTLWLALSSSVTGLGSVSAHLSEVDSLSASIFGVGSSYGLLTCRLCLQGTLTGVASVTNENLILSIFLSALAQGVGTEDALLSLEQILHGSAAGTATASATPMYMYYGGVPVLISDWASVLPSQIIHTSDWESILTAASTLIKTTTWDQT